MVSLVLVMSNTCYLELIVLLRFMVEFNLGVFSVTPNMVLF